MKDVEKKIAELFDRASTQNPVVSFEETWANFLTSISTGAGVSISSALANIVFSVKGVLFIVFFFVTTCILLVQKSDENKYPSLLPDTDQILLNFGQGSDSVLIKQHAKKTIKNKKEINSVELNSTPFFSEKKLKIKSINKIEQPSVQQKDKKYSSLINVPFSDSLKSNVVLAEKNDTSKFVLEAEQKDFMKLKLPDNSFVKDSIMLFTINELSTESDFSNIAKQAREAGIVFKYQVHHQRLRKGKKRKKIKTEDVYLIRDFKINMTIDGTGKSSQVSVKVSKRGKFEVNFGWQVNQEGKAIAFMESSDVTEASSFYPKKKK